MTTIELKYRARYAAKLRYYRWVGSFAGVCPAERNVSARFFAKRDMEEGT